MDNLTLKLGRVFVSLPNKQELHTLQCRWLTCGCETLSGISNLSRRCHHYAISTNLQIAASLCQHICFLAPAVPKSQIWLTCYTKNECSEMVHWTTQKQKRLLSRGIYSPVSHTNQKTLYWQNVKSKRSQSTYIANYNYNYSTRYNKNLEVLL